MLTLMKGPPGHQVYSDCENQFCLLSERGEQKSNGFTQHDIITIPIVWLKTQTAFLGQAFYEKVNYKIDPFEQTLLLKVM